MVRDQNSQPIQTNHFESQYSHTSKNSLWGQCMHKITSTETFKSSKSSYYFCNIYNPKRISLRFTFLRLVLLSFHFICIHQYFKIIFFIKYLYFSFGVSFIFTFNNILHWHGYIIKKNNNNKTKTKPRYCRKTYTRMCRENIWYLIFARLL